ncbi:MAG: PEP-CTERM sorting domain-containing protein [Isosphaeraceae bacterium]
MMVASGQRSLAVDIFNSFTGEPPNYVATLPLNPGDLFAQQIETTSANTVIGSLELALGNFNKNSIGTFDISIYTSNNNNEPGTLVSGSLLSGLNAATLPDATSIDLPRRYLGLNINLPTAGKYFVVLNNYTGSFALGWASSTAPSPPYPGLISGINVAGGPGWQSLGNSSPFLLKVSPANVPEPSTWAMMTIAAGTLAGLGYRRRAAKA